MLGRYRHRFARPRWSPSAVEQARRSLRQIGALGCRCMLHLSTRTPSGIVLASPAYMVQFPASRLSTAMADPDQTTASPPKKEERAMFARDIMTHEVISISPTATIRDAARLLSEYNISGAPVIDAEGRMVGIITQ